MNVRKAGGSQWNAWSSRLVTTSLEVGSGQLHVLSCYAPTFAVPREEDMSSFMTIFNLHSSIDCDGG